MQLTHMFQNFVHVKAFFKDIHSESPGLSLLAFWLFPGVIYPVYLYPVWLIVVLTVYNFTSCLLTFDKFDFLSFDFYPIYFLSFDFLSYNLSIVLIPTGNNCRPTCPASRRYRVIILRPSAQLSMGSVLSQTFPPLPRPCLQLMAALRDDLFHISASLWSQYFAGTACYAD